MVKKSALKKDFYREIRRTRGRFLSILLIVALGVAFLSGLRCAAPDMRATGDAYFDRNQLYDGKIVSTMGLTDSDADAVLAVDGVEAVEKIHSVDALFKLNDKERAIHVLNIPQTLNKITVEEGRMPEKTGECLMDAELKSVLNLSVGDTIHLESGTEDSLSDTLAADTYTIVGFASSPVYISFTRGSTTIGNGDLSGYLFVRDSDFKTDYYSEIDYSVAGAAGQTAFTDGYDEIVAAAEDQVTSIEDARCQARRDQLAADAEKELDDARDQLASSKADTEQKLSDALSEIESNEATLADSREQIDDGRSQIETARQNLDEKKTELDSAIDEYNSGSEKLQEAVSQLSELQSAYQLASRNPYADPTQLYQMTYAIDTLETQIVSSKASLDTAYQTITDGQTAIEEGYSEIASKEAELDKAEKEWQDGSDALADARADYEQGRIDADTELANAQSDIDKAEDEISDIETPKWYVSVRMDDDDYSGYYDNTVRMKNISLVFPFVFFLVAALISLTSMTRMVEEHRTQIGTLKALGYGKLDILNKYIKYALFATGGGSIIGVLAGEQIFPRIIVSSYGIMYHHIPDQVITYQLDKGAFASLTAIICVLAATGAAVYGELRSEPAKLMRPPAPKKGKRILMERIPFLWKRLSFLWKATLRNLARYKKRFFMTIFGIGGSMALILVGFGLKDSIMGIVTIQYEEVQLYDADVFLKDGVTEEEKSNLGTYLNNELGTGNSLEVYEKSAKISGNAAGTRKAYLVVPSDTEEMKSFVCLRDRVSGEDYNLTDDGVVISEKLSKFLDVGVGDTITVDLDDGHVGQAVVTAICENYLYHYVYMTPALYEKLYNASPPYNDYMISIPNIDSEKDTVTNDILKQDGVININYLGNLQSRVEEMLTVLNQVIVVLVVSAGMLTFIVLYSLNSINITERARELATIKLLGFYDIELASYIYRENILLTCLSLLFGVAAGNLLHRYLITTVEIDTVMFGRNINPRSYLWSVLLTLLFTAIVNFAMFYRLRKIDMVESLKSVE